MDLRLEAAAASELRDNHKKDTDIYIPKIFWKATSKRVLTMEWVSGIPIYKTKEIEKQGHDLTRIVTSFIIMFLNQAYRDGFFHADLHPGNIIIMQDGKIGLIDFGIMGRLDHKTRLYLAEILRGFLGRDYEHVARVHFTAGYVPRSKSMGSFAQACRAIGEPIVDLPGSKISIGKLLTHLFKVTKDFDMVTQPQLLLIQKTTVVVEGLAVKLSPNINMWKVAEPWIKDWSAKNLKLDSKIMHSIDSWIDFLNNDFRDFIRYNNSYYKENLTDDVEG